MVRKSSVIFWVVMALLFALGSGFLISYPKLKPDTTQEFQPSRMVIPKNPVPRESGEEEAASEGPVYQDMILSKAALPEGETLISSISQNFDDDPAEEQLIAFRRLGEVDSPIYISYIDYQDESGTYERVWESPTLITRPGTLNMYAADLTGDRSVCAVLTGMNGDNEQVLTAFQKTGAGSEEAFVKIAELRTAGSITVNNIERSLGYQKGLTQGEPFTITAYGNDPNSSNILDQIEFTWRYNPSTGLYEESKAQRIPGVQVAQRQVQEILSGQRGKFEEFITGLWYLTGTGSDSRQYIAFNPQEREIIFYENQTQQVFSWTSSAIKRYGLYITCQNVSVSNLRRFLDIELESLESLRIRVSDDVRMKIGVTDPLNGSYRKASAAELRGKETEQQRVSAFVDAVYDGTFGKLSFSPQGSYVLSNASGETEGRYAFFMLENQEYLELRTEKPASRDVFLVEKKAAGDQDAAEQLTLKRVRLGAQGRELLPEAPIALIRSGAQ